MIVGRQSVLTMLLACSLCAGQAPAPAQETSAAQDSIPGTSAASESNAATGLSAGKQLDYWLGALDSDAYEVRATATEQLLSLDPSGIQQLAAALPTGSLEMIHRGTYVLQQLTLTGRHEQQEAAQQQLETLAAQPPSAASRRARASLRSVATVLRQRAIAELSSAGAQYQDGYVQTSFGTAAVPYGTLRIGTGWRGSVENLKVLRWLPELQRIVLEGSHIDDQWLKRLSIVKKLRVLQIRKAKITDRGLDHLRQFEDLQTLEMYYVPLTDASIPALKRLAIQQLRLIGNELTPEGIQQFNAPISEVDIRPGGAFLGISCASRPEATDEEPAGCVVTLVRPNSAAATAGLAMNDVIQQYDGKPVVVFEDLMKLIGANRPEDVVDIKVFRPGNPKGKTLELKVPLGEWSMAQR